jgi:membrane-bound lytic murein transglycosylase D
LIRKISVLGIVFFLFSTYLSDVNAQEEEFFDRQLLEGSSLQERLGSPLERSSSFDSSLREESHVAALETPISGEFIYDFNLELLLGDWPKKALIESGFDPYAYSRSKAVGPWQFIYRTGKRYGLKVNWWVDERRDPEKSTIAAAKYLKDLYEMFACWYLAAAGYNAGEYKIIKAMKRFQTEDFWTLTKHRYLKRETKNYVPLMIAAAVVAKDPEKYGFTGVEYQEPLRYEKVKVPELTDLSHIAKACEISLEEIKDLNPELRRGVTPPNEPEYEIKIPFAKIDLFSKNFEAMQPLEKFQFRTHTVKKGETLRGIANLYRVDLDPMLEINYLNKTSPLTKGMDLLIPISKDEEIKPLAVAQKKNGKAQNGSSRGK